MRVFKLVKHKFALFVFSIINRFLDFPDQLTFSGEGSSVQLARHITRIGHKRVLLVTDKILMDIGIADGLKQSIADSGAELFVFDGVTPDPTTDVVSAGLAAYNENKCDSILALGGGSSIDCAKAIAASATNGDVLKLVGLLKVKIPAAPLFAIPTTSGTGSEVTFAAVISDAATHKKGFLVDTGIIPLAIALDPTLLTGMPAHITSATGMDALTHAVETYIGVWADDRVVEQSLTATKLIFEYLPRAYADGSDLEAREAMSLASYYAGLSINTASVGNVHAIAHQLGAFYGTPHGLANGVVMPYILDVSVESAEKPLAELARAIGEGDASDSDAVLARMFVAAVRRLNDTVGIPATVEALKTSDIPAIAKDAADESNVYPVPILLLDTDMEAVLHKMIA